MLVERMLIKSAMPARVGSSAAFRQKKCLLPEMEQDLADNSMLSRFGFMCNKKKKNAVLLDRDSVSTSGRTGWLEERLLTLSPQPAGDRVLAVGMWPCLK